MRSFLLFGVGLLSLVACDPNAASSDPTTDELMERVTQLEAQLSEYEETLAKAHDLLQFISISDSQITVTGANLQLVDGSGNTDNRRAMGTGNLIIGYNEVPTEGEVIRTGSHNIIVGAGHSYSGTSGIVAGSLNSISENGVVLGGMRNHSSGGGVIVNGRSNQSTGTSSTILNGSHNVASGDNSTIVGGYGNRADGYYQVVSCSEDCIHP